VAGKIAATLRWRKLPAGNFPVTGILGKVSFVEEAPPPIMPPPAEIAAPISLPSAQRSAALSILLAGAGGIIGAITGGLWGAGAGILLGGAARNAWRAQSGWSSADEPIRNEAAKSATMAAIGVAAGGLLAYQAYSATKEKK